MPFYAQINNGYVHTVSQLRDQEEKDNLIELEKYDTTLMGKHYDSERGFYEKIIKAETVKTEISVGEVIEISFYWQDENGEALSETEAFHVDVDGQQVEVPVGETLEFSSDEAGEFIIRTVNDNVENAELTVVVTDG